MLSAPSLLMASALRDSEIRYDASGNPALEKARQRGRIDACLAAVIAIGLAELHCRASASNSCRGSKSRSCRKTVVLWATAWISCLLNDLEQSHSIRHGGFKPP